MAQKIVNKSSLTAETATRNLPFDGDDIKKLIRRLPRGSGFVEGRRDP
jgi:hypothetical protein